MIIREDNMALNTLMYLILGIIIGGILGFFIARYFLKKQIKENPPINEKMIRAMFLQMGRKPSEAQIRAVMKSLDIK